MALPTRPVLTIDAAKKMAETCKEYAKNIGHPAVIVAVADAGGYLLYLERMDGISPGTVQVATLKAQCAAVFGSETKKWEDAVADGLIGTIVLAGMAPFEGGVPVLVDGQIVGAIAISGITKELDGEIAKAGAIAIAKILTDED
jgi:glc operon protein GlcG